MGSDRDKHAGRRRQIPRYVVGSVNLTEFSITFATSATFIVTLESANLAPVIPLVFGGLVSAPFAGYLVKIVSNRLLMLIVGSLLSQAKNFRQIINTRNVDTVDPDDCKPGVSGVLGGVDLAKHSQTVSCVCKKKTELTVLVNAARTTPLNTPNTPFEK